MSEPMVMVSYSDDGGHTFSAEQHYPLGVAGNYGKRFCMYAQGASLNRVYKIRMSDNRSFTIISAHADIEVGDD